MAIMWSAASFCTYLMMMLNKYLEGTIYMNYWLEGLAGLLGNFIAIRVYEELGLRSAFIVSMGITLFGASLIYLFEAGLFNPSFVVSIGLSVKSLDPVQSD